MNDIKTLSKPMKENVELEYECMVEGGSLFETAINENLRDDEIRIMLESAFGEECFDAYDEYDNSENIISICESAESGEISYSEAIELISLLEN